jgi:hypothetical protein
LLVKPAKLDQEVKTHELQIQQQTQLLVGTYKLAIDSDSVNQPLCPPLAVPNFGVKQNPLAVAQYIWWFNGTHVVIYLEDA